jgi:hypothetical protein
MKHLVFKAEVNEGARLENVGGGWRKNRIINGGAIGTGAQLLALYGGFGFVGVILAILILVTGIYVRIHPVKPLPPPPQVSEKRAYRSYMTRFKNRKAWEKVEFVAWGLSMILVEAIVITIFYLFGFQFPTAPR